MQRDLGIFLATVAFAGSLSATEPEPSLAQQYVVAVLIQDVSTERSAGKVSSKTLSQAKVLTEQGKDFRYQVGATLGSPKVPLGTLLNARVDLAAEGKLRVRGVLEVATGKGISGDIVLRESTAVHFAKTVSPGEKTRVPLRKSGDGELWFELQVDTLPLVE